MPKTEAYSIRVAEENDAYELVGLAAKFFKDTGNKEVIGWDASKVFDNISSAIEREDFLVLVFEYSNTIVGFFIGFCTPSLFSDAIQGAEVAWYVDKEHRGSRKSHEMLDEYEEWAKENGAVCINLVNLEVLQPEKVAALYKKKGYRLAENTFLKEI